MGWDPRTVIYPGNPRRAAMPWKLTTDSRITARAFERQMSNWELARLQRLEKAKAKRLPVEDFLTISREVGVRGEEVAHAL